VNAIEAGELLGVCAAFDRRKAGPTDALAWAKALADLPYDDCEQAVIGHYNETTDWCMPAHVRRRVKAMHAARLDRTLPDFSHEVESDPALWLASLRKQRGTIASPPGAGRHLEIAPEPRRAIGGAR
jgi:hypothetical protein